MSRWRPGAATLAVLLAVAAAAPAAELTTSIDLNYRYKQTHAADDIDADTAYGQKYEAKVNAKQGQFDFVGAARLELEDTWSTSAATTTRTVPNLELGAKGRESSAKVSFQAVLSERDAYQERADAETYSTRSEARFEVTPATWPETALRLRRTRSIHPGSEDLIRRESELSLRKTFEGFVLEYDFRHNEQDAVLPETNFEESTERRGRLTYKGSLWSEAEFELSYEIVDTQRRKTARDVFRDFTEESKHQIRTVLQKTLELSPRANLKLGWKLNYQEDLLGLNFDTNNKQEYLATLRYDMLSWARVSAEYTRQLGVDQPQPPEDEERARDDNLAVAVDLKPLGWLSVTTKAKVKWEQDVKSRSGGSVDRKRQETYEAVARARFEKVEGTLNAATRSQYDETLLTNRETKFRADAKWRPIQDFSVGPFYEVTRLSHWVAHLPYPDEQKRIQEWKLIFEYRRQFLDVLSLTFSHDYQIKDEDVLDEALDFESTVGLNENTRLNLVFADFIEGLKLEGEVARVASDTLDDEEPMIVDVSYALKLDYKYKFLVLASTFKYSDKGDAFDDMTLGAKVEIRGDVISLAGDYQYGKTFADETNERRELNLRLKAEF